MSEAPKIPRIISERLQAAAGGAGEHPEANQLSAFAENLLRAVLLGIYLFWLLSPLLGYALSDSYDITKLFLYPITSRQIFVGAILGSILDFPVLLLLPTLLAALISFAHSPAAGILTGPL